MSWAAVAIAAGAAISAGVSSASSSSAGKSAKGAASTAAKSFAATGKQASGIIDKAGKKSLALLAPFQEKLGNVGGTIRDTLAADQDQLPNVARLARGVNQLNQNELDRLLGKALPGVKDMVQLASNNTLSMLRGEIPADVAAKVRRTTGQAALQSGFSGSESSSALTARDLGITSTNLMEEGSNSAQRWIQTARSQLMPALFDPTSMLATPQLTLSSILASAGIAKDQAEIINTTAARKAGVLVQTANAATSASLDGSAAQIAANKASADAIGKGVQGVSGAAGGYFSGGNYQPSPGVASAGSGAQNIVIPSSVYSGWSPGPQSGTYYVPTSKAA